MRSYLGFRVEILPIGYCAYHVRGWIRGRTNLQDSDPDKYRYGKLAWRDTPVRLGSRVVCKKLLCLVGAYNLYLITPRA